MSTGVLSGGMIIFVPMDKNVLGIVYFRLPSKILRNSADLEKL